MIIRKKQQSVELISDKEKKTWVCSNILIADKVTRKGLGKESQDLLLPTIRREEDFLQFFSQIIITFWSYVAAILRGIFLAVKFEWKVSCGNRKVKRFVHRKQEYMHYQNPSFMPSESFTWIYDQVYLSSDVTPISKVR